ncbi:MAG TPA: hypothetical protein VL634_20580, partial [Mycobacterium sp.]|nr:hypothetical protein [Mycobacterium sp.]
AATSVVGSVSSVAPTCLRAAARNTHANGDSVEPPEPTPRTDDTRLVTRALIGDVVVLGWDGSGDANVAVAVADDGVVVADGVVAAAAESCWSVAEGLAFEVDSAVFAGFTVRFAGREVAVRVAFAALVFGSCCVRCVVDDFFFLTGWSVCSSSDFSSSLLVVESVVDDESVF